MITDVPAVTAATPASVRPTRPGDNPKRFATVTLVVLLVWAVASANVKWGKIADAPAGIYTVFRLMFSQMSGSYIGRCLEAMWFSVAMAWLGTLLAALVAVPLSFLAAENLVPRWFSFLIRQVFNVLRAIPEVVIVIALIPILGLTPNAGVMALAIGSIGTLSKLCSEVVEGIDGGPIEAADAVGASAIERLRWAVLPQSLPEIASFVLYRFEINVRVSAILGALGIGGIGGILRLNLEFRNWGVAGVALLTVVVVTIAVDLISGAIRRRLVAGPRGSRTMEEPIDITAMLEAEV